jgi:hypothetical protein
MNTNTVTSLTGKSWTVGTSRVSFSSQSRNWGVMNADGLVLAKEGTPSTWTTKAIAEQVAPYADGFAGHEWIEVTP